MIVVVVVVIIVCVSRLLVVVVFVLFVVVLVVVVVVVKRMMMMMMMMMMQKFKSNFEFCGVHEEKSKQFSLLKKGNESLAVSSSCKFFSPREREAVLLERFLNGKRSLIKKRANLRSLFFFFVFHA